MTRTERFIIDNYLVLSAGEMSHKLHLPKSKILDILTANGLTARAEKATTKRLPRKQSNICAGRPEACFDCPYPDCTCVDSQNDNEIIYKFAGIRSDSETAIDQRRRGRTKKGRTP